jgi:hypothetical protein
MDPEATAVQQTVMAAAAEEATAVDKQSMMAAASGETAAVDQQSVMAAASGETAAVDQQSMMAAASGETAAVHQKSVMAAASGETAAVHQQTAVEAATATANPAVEAAVLVAAMMSEGEATAVIPAMVPTAVMSAVEAAAVVHAVEATVPTAVVPAVVSATAVVPAIVSVAVTPEAVPTAVVPAVVSAAVMPAMVPTAVMSAAEAAAVIPTAIPAPRISAVEAAAAIQQLRSQLQNLESQVRRLQCELKSVQKNQSKLPAPRSSRNRSENNGDGGSQCSSDGELQQPQVNSNLALAVGSRGKFQKYDADIGKVAELRLKSSGEWERIERLLREKLQKIRSERLRQFDLKYEEIKAQDNCALRGNEYKFEDENEFKESWNAHYSKHAACGMTDLIHSNCITGSETSWLHDPELIEEEIAEALQQEKQYEKCNYRRTACKVIECLVGKYNTVWSYKVQTWNPTCVRVAYGEVTKCKQWTFDQHGLVSKEHEFLVDPGRFWSYDLHRSKVYGERPL